MYMVGENCPGCGKCTMGVCPTKAITMKNNKAVIGQECIDCDLCIPVCPINVIKKKADSQQAVKAPEVNTAKEVDSNATK